MGKSVEFFENVPDGSRLEVSFGPENCPIAASVLIVAGGLDDRTWSDVDVRPGPGSLKLAKGQAYMLELRAAFFKQATATIEARIFEPGGAAFLSPITWSIDGESDSIELRVLIVRMAQ